MVYRYRLFAAMAACMMMLAIPAALRAQSWQWARLGSGTQNDLAGGVAVDSAGNTYVVGTFENNIAFGATIFTNGTSTGLFLVKYSPAGAFQWGVQGLGAGAGSGNFLNPSVAVSRTGEVVIAGGYNGAVRFGTDTIRSTGGYDVFIARFSTVGALRWLRGAGRGVQNAFARGVAIDNTLSSYVTGYFADTARFDTATVRSNGRNDVFLAKYNNNGSLAWLTGAGGAYNEEAYGIGLDATGNSYVAGIFADSSMFGIDTIVAAGGNDAFVAKFTDLGAPAWATAIGGTLDDAALAIAADQFGNSYVTGTFRDSASFGDSVMVSADSSDDIFIAKLDGAGGVRWSEQAGGPGDDAGLGITVDDLGSVYATGRYADSASFGDSLAVDTAGTGDIFIAKYTGSGALQWLRSAGGPGMDEGRDIAIDLGGELRVVGAFSGTARFGPLSLTSGGGLDLFVAKLGADPTIVIGTILERTFCPGDQFQIPFTVKGIFDPTNSFTAQLSDSSGSFASPVEIGSVFGIGGTVIIGRIPDTVIPGTHYRVRVVSNSPVAIGGINEFPLTIYSRPVATVTPSGPVTICRGETVTLDAGPGFGSYLWITGETTRTIVVSRSGDFTVTVANEHGCSATSEAVHVTMITAAKPMISKTGTTLSSTEAAAYQWSFNGSPISGATTRTITAQQEGFYTVSITDTNGCTAVSDPFNFTLSGVTEDLAAGSMAIYPHPNTGLFTVSVAIPRSGEVRGSVIDAAGRTVGSWIDQSAGGAYSRRVDIEREPAGLYFVRIESAGRSWVREVVKR